MSLINRTNKIDSSKLKETKQKDKMNLGLGAGQYYYISTPTFIMFVFGG